MKLKIEYEEFVCQYPERYYSALFYPKFLSLKGDKTTFRKIKEGLPQVRESTLYQWIAGRMPLPFKEFSRIKKIFDTEDIDSLATIIGHVFGDGGITKGMFLGYSNTEKFLIDEFRHAMKKVFSTEPTTCYHSESSGIIRLTYPRLFARVLLCLFGEFSLGKDSKKITPQIENMPVNWKAKLLCAWYNDDGSVPDSKSYKCVTFKQKDKNLILWIQKTLKELNIKSELDKDGSLWHLRILNHLDMIKFKNKVGFSKGYRKQAHLDKIIKEAKCPHWKTKMDIIKLLRKRPRTAKELAKYLNLETGTIHGHLHGWKRGKRAKRKSTSGLIDMSLVRVKRDERRYVYFLNEKGYKKFGKILNLEKLFR